MALRRMELRQHARRDSLSEDLHRWMEMVRRLPAMRVEKVVAMRAALRSSSYDNEHIFEQTVARLGNDIGILCRRELTEGHCSDPSDPPNGA
ncbi:MAG: hypothetical protein JSU86_17575 [Phycisphaerales bacterium]|nr:MAG: hypothetical protein JSU86_17575 [Phycisphaerales bacterium]